MNADEDKIIVLDGGYGDGFSIKSDNDSVIQEGIYLKAGKVIMRNVKVRRRL
jgi:hypothetical protein